MGRDYRRKETRHRRIKVADGIRLVYYCEELDTEVEVIVEDGLDIEDYKPKKCIFTGETIDDFWYEDLED